MQLASGQRQSSRATEMTKHGSPYDMKSHRLSLFDEQTEILIFRLQVCNLHSVRYLHLAVMTSNLMPFLNLNSN